ncbi:DUF2637 domain-containing protein [Actinomadura nitritigenes]|uniref:DUF2637 domain-containing protein n=1 Tax=Actinomadura nitritigenes TaxID=134602 RepID=UPI003D913AB8
MSWDIKSERIAARAQAEQARAQAEAVRAQTELAREKERAEQARQARADRRAEREKDRAERAKRRAETIENLRARGPVALAAVAVGSPAALAWRGQFLFGLDDLHLGWMAPLAPVAVEGGVLYAAWMAHQAVAAQVPSFRYRALVWTLAAVAAGTNAWHGHDAQSGAMLALFSLLSIVLLEFTIALRKAQVTKEREGRDVAVIRRALVRRVRYPRLSTSASALAAARGITPEEAWRAAWIERYGLGPEAPRHERKVARQVLKREEKAAKKAAKKGALTIADGQLVPALWFDDDPFDDADDAQSAAVSDDAATGTPDGGAESAPTGEGERLDTTSMKDVIDTMVAFEAPEGIAAIERWLRVRAEGPGALRELPPGHGDERRQERRDERTGERREERREERSDERREERREERRDERDDERREERQEEQRDERREERGGKRRGERRKERRARRLSGGRAPQREHGERLERVRRLLTERPDLTGAQVAVELGIGESTARKLLQKARQDSKGGDQR